MTVPSAPPPTAARPVARRAMLRAAAGILASRAVGVFAAGGLGAGGPVRTPSVAAQTPAATPAAMPTAKPSPERVDAFVAFSQALVGGGRIDPGRAAQFLQLNDADPERAAALGALLAIDPATAIAEGVQASPVKPILHFWYRGVFDGHPVPGRDTFWYGLSAWQAVTYTSSTSICKRFGDWAEAPVVR